MSLIDFFQTNAGLSVLRGFTNTVTTLKDAVMELKQGHADRQRATIALERIADSLEVYNSCKGYRRPQEEQLEKLREVNLGPRAPIVKGTKPTTVHHEHADACEHNGVCNEHDTCGCCYACNHESVS